MPVLTPHVPDGLIDIMKALTKSILKEKPENIYEFAVQHFEKLIAERDGSLDKGYELFRSERTYFQTRDKCEKIILRSHYRQGSSSKSLVKKIDTSDLEKDNQLPISAQRKLKARKLSSRKPSQTLIVIKEDDDEEAIKNEIESEMRRRERAAFKIQKAFKGFLERLKQDKGSHMSEQVAALIIQRTLRTLFSRRLKEKQATKEILQFNTENTDQISEGAVDHNQDGEDGHSSSLQDQISTEATYEPAIKAPLRQNSDDQHPSIAFGERCSSDQDMKEDVGLSESVVEIIESDAHEMPSEKDNLENIHDDSQSPALPNKSDSTKETLNHLEISVEQQSLIKAMEETRKDNEKLKINEAILIKDTRTSQESLEKTVGDDERNSLDTNEAPAKTDMSPVQEIIITDIDAVPAKTKTSDGKSYSTQDDVAVQDHYLSEEMEAIQSENKSSSANNDHVAKDISTEQKSLLREMEQSQFLDNESEINKAPSTENISADDTSVSKIMGDVQHEISNEKQDTEKIQSTVDHDSPVKAVNDALIEEVELETTGSNHSNEQFDEKQASSEELSLAQYPEQGLNKTEIKSPSLRSLESERDSAKLNDLTTHEENLLESEKALNDSMNVQELDNPSFTSTEATEKDPSTLKCALETTSDDNKNSTPIPSTSTDSAISLKHNLEDIKTDELMKEASPKEIPNHVAEEKMSDTKKESDIYSNGTHTETVISATPLASEARMMESELQGKPELFTNKSSTSLETESNLVEESSHSYPNVNSDEHQSLMQVLKEQKMFIHEERKNARYPDLTDHRTATNLEHIENDRDNTTSNDNKLPEGTMFGTPVNHTTISDSSKTIPLTDTGNKVEKISTLDAESLNHAPLVASALNLVSADVMKVTTASLLTPIIESDLQDQLDHTNKDDCEPNTNVENQTQNVSNSSKKSIDILSQTPSDIASDVAEINTETKEAYKVDSLKSNEDVEEDNKVNPSHGYQNLAPVTLKLVTEQAAETLKSPETIVSQANIQETNENINEITSQDNDIQLNSKEIIDRNKKQDIHSQEDAVFLAENTKDINIANANNTYEVSDLSNMTPKEVVIENDVQVSLEKDSIKHDGSFVKNQLIEKEEASTLEEMKAINLSDQQNESTTEIAQSSVESKLPSKELENKLSKSSGDEANEDFTLSESNEELIKNQPSSIPSESLDKQIYLESKPSNILELEEEINLTVQAEEDSRRTKRSIEMDSIADMEDKRDNIASTEVESLAESVRDFKAKSELKNVAVNNSIPEFINGENKVEGTLQAHQTAGLETKDKDVNVTEDTKIAETEHECSLADKDRKQEMKAEQEEHFCGAENLNDLAKKDMDEINPDVLSLNTGNITETSCAMVFENSKENSKDNSETALLIETSNPPITPIEILSVTSEKSCSNEPLSDANLDADGAAEHSVLIFGDGDIKENNSGNTITQNNSHQTTIGEIRCMDNEGKDTALLESAYDTVELKSVEGFIEPNNIGENLVDAINDVNVVRENVPDLINIDDKDEKASDSGTTERIIEVDDVLKQNENCDDLHDMEMMLLNVPENDLGDVLENTGNILREEFKRRQDSMTKDLNLDDLQNDDKTTSFEEQQQEAKCHENLLDRIELPMSDSEVFEVQSESVNSFATSEPNSSATIIGTKDSLKINAEREGSIDDQVNELNSQTYTRDEVINEDGKLIVINDLPNRDEDNHLKIVDRNDSPLNLQKDSSQEDNKSVSNNVNESESPKQGVVEKDFASGESREKKDQVLMPKTKGSNDDSHSAVKGEIISSKKAEDVVPLKEINKNVTISPQQSMKKDNCELKDEDNDKDAAHTCISPISDDKFTNQNLSEPNIQQIQCEIEQFDELDPIIENDEELNRNDLVTADINSVVTTKSFDEKSYEGIKTSNNVTNTDNIQTQEHLMMLPDKDMNQYHSSDEIISLSLNKKFKEHSDDVKSFPDKSITSLQKNYDILKEGSLTSPTVKTLSTESKTPQTSNKIVDQNVSAEEINNKLNSIHTPFDTNIEDGSETLLDENDTLENTRTYKVVSDGKNIDILLLHGSPDSDWVSDERVLNNGELEDDLNTNGNTDCSNNIDSPIDAGPIVVESPKIAKTRKDLEMVRSSPNNGDEDAKVNCQNIDEPKGLSTKNEHNRDTSEDEHDKSLTDSNTDEEETTLPNMGQMNAPEELILPSESGNEASENEYPVLNEVKFEEKGILLNHNNDNDQQKCSEEISEKETEDSLKNKGKMIIQADPFEHLLVQIPGNPLCSEYLQSTEENDDQSIRKSLKKSKYSSEGTPSSVVSTENPDFPSVSGGQHNVSDESTTESDRYTILDSVAQNNDSHQSQLNIGSNYHLSNKASTANDTFNQAHNVPLDCISTEEKKYVNNLIEPTSSQPDNFGVTYSGTNDSITISKTPDGTHTEGNTINIDPITNQEVLENTDTPFVVIIESKSSSVQPEVSVENLSMKIFKDIEQADESFKIVTSPSSDRVLQDDKIIETHVSPIESISKMERNDFIENNFESTTRPEDSSEKNKDQLPLNPNESFNSLESYNQREKEVKINQLSDGNKDEVKHNIDIIDPMLVSPSENLPVKVDDSREENQHSEDRKTAQNIGPKNIIQPPSASLEELNQNRGQEFKETTDLKIFENQKQVPLSNHENNTEDLRFLNGTETKPVEGIVDSKPVKVKNLNLENTENSKEDAEDVSNLSDSEGNDNIKDDGTVEFDSLNHSEDSNNINGDMTLSRKKRSSPLHEEESHNSDFTLSELETIIETPVTNENIKHHEQLVDRLEKLRNTESDIKNTLNFDKNSGNNMSKHNSHESTLKLPKENENSSDGTYTKDSEQIEDAKITMADLIEVNQINSRGSEDIRENNEQVTSIDDTREESPTMSETQPINDHLDGFDDQIYHQPSSSAKSKRDQCPSQEALEHSLGDAEKDSKVQRDNMDTPGDVADNLENSKRLLRDPQINKIFDSIPQGDFQDLVSGQHDENLSIPMKYNNVDLDNTQKQETDFENDVQPKYSLHDVTDSIEKLDVKSPDSPIHYSNDDRESTLTPIQEEIVQKVKVKNLTKDTSDKTKWSFNSSTGSEELDPTNLATSTVAELEPFNIPSNLESNSDNIPICSNCATDDHWKYQFSDDFVNMNDELKEEDDLNERISPRIKNEDSLISKNPDLESYNSIPTKEKDADSTHVKYPQNVMEANVENKAMTIHPNRSENSIEKESCGENVSNNLTLKDNVERLSGNTNKKTSMESKEVYGKSDEIDTNNNDAKHDGSNSEHIYKYPSGMSFGDFYNDSEIPTVIDKTIKRSADIKEDIEEMGEKIHDVKKNIEDIPSLSTESSVNKQSIPEKTYTEVLDLIESKPEIKPSLTHKSTEDRYNKWTPRSGLEARKEVDVNDTKNFEQERSDDSQSTYPNDFDPDTLNDAESIGVPEDTTPFDSLNALPNSQVQNDVKILGLLGSEQGPQSALEEDNLKRKSSSGTDYENNKSVLEERSEKQERSITNMEGASQNISKDFETGEPIIDYSGLGSKILGKREIFDKTPPQVDKHQSESISNRKVSRNIELHEEADPNKFKYSKELGSGYKNDPNIPAEQEKSALDRQIITQASNPIIDILNNSQDIVHIDSNEEKEEKIGSGHNIISHNEVVEKESINSNAPSHENDSNKYDKIEEPAESNDLLQSSNQIETPISDQDYKLTQNTEKDTLTENKSSNSNIASIPKKAIEIFNTAAETIQRAFKSYDDLKIKDAENKEEKTTAQVLDLDQSVKDSVMKMNDEMKNTPETKGKWFVGDDPIVTTTEKENENLEDTKDILDKMKIEMTVDMTHKLGEDTQIVGDDPIFTSSEKENVNLEDSKDILDKMKIEMTIDTSHKLDEDPQIIDKDFLTQETVLSSIHLKEAASMQETPSSSQLDNDQILICSEDTLHSDIIPNNNSQFDDINKIIKHSQDPEVAEDKQEDHFKDLTEEITPNEADIVENQLGIIESSKNSTANLDSAKPESNPQEIIDNISFEIQNENEIEDSHNDDGKSLKSASIRTEKDAVFSDKHQNNSSSNDFMIFTTSDKSPEEDHGEIYDSSSLQASEKDPTTVDEPLKSTEQEALCKLNEEESQHFNEKDTNLLPNNLMVFTTSDKPIKKYHQESLESDALKEDVSNELGVQNMTANEDYLDESNTEPPLIFLQSTTENLDDLIDSTNDSVLVDAHTREDPAEIISSALNTVKDPTSTDESLVKLDQSTFKSDETVLKSNELESPPISDDTEIKKNDDSDAFTGAPHNASNTAESNDGSPTIQEESPRSDVENMDISIYGEDSLEAMYYSLRKHEYLLDKMHKQASICKSASSERVKDDHDPCDSKEEIKSNEKEKLLSKNQSDDVDVPVVPSVIFDIENNESTTNSNSDPPEISVDIVAPRERKLSRNESYYTACLSRPITSATISPRSKSEHDAEDVIGWSKQKSEQFIQKLHADHSLDDISNDEIRRNILAYSISEADSDYCVPAERTNAIFNDFNISTALEHTPSTDTDSTIVSAVTKIQAGARGFLTRRRLRRASVATTSFSDRKPSFGNDAIGESLEDLIDEEDAARRIQKSFRRYRDRRTRQSAPTLTRNIIEVDSSKSSTGSSEEGAVPIIEIKVEHKSSASSQNRQSETAHVKDKDSLHNDSSTESKSSSDNVELGSLDSGNSKKEFEVSFDGINLAARRMTLQRGDAVQRNSTPEDESSSLSGTGSSNQSGETQSSHKKLPLRAKSSGTERREKTFERQNNLERAKRFGTRQRTMPVQIDFEILRVLPKHLRKRIRSADQQSKSKSEF